MAEPALQQLSARSQLMRTRNTVVRDRQPIPQARGNVLPFQKKRSRTQHNLSRLQDVQTSLPRTRMQQVRDSFAGAMALQDDEYKIRHQLELAQKAQLAQERQRIRAEMESYKLPEMRTGGYEEPEQLDAMQKGYEEEFNKQMQTPEFLKAAEEKIQGKYKQMEARMRKNRVNRHRKRAAKQAQATAEKIKKATQAASGTAKLGWDTENALSLLDSLDPADLEIPTLFTIVVQMYRACTALLNNGEKFIKGFIGFIEPAPLFRFWHPKDIERAMNESVKDPILGGGTELENTIESLFVGWPEALLGWIVVGIILLLIFVFAVFVFIIVLLGSVSAMTAIELLTS